MAIRLLLHFCAVLLLITIQLSVLPNLPLLHYLNLLLVILVLLSFTSDKKTVILWFIVSALIMDIWSFYMFGANILIYSVIMTLILLALNNFITNKSLYSYWLLLLSATILYEFFWILVLNWPNPLIISQMQLIIILKKISINLITGTIIYYFTNWLGHSLQSVILVRAKK